MLSFLTIITYTISMICGCYTSAFRPWLPLLHGPVPCLSWNGNGRSVAVGGTAVFVADSQCFDEFILWPESDGKNVRMWWMSLVKCFFNDIWFFWCFCFMRKIMKKETKKPWDSISQPVMFSQPVDILSEPSCVKILQDILSDHLAITRRWLWRTIVNWIWPYMAKHMVCTLNLPSGYD